MRLPTMALTRSFLTNELGLVEHVDWEKTEHQVYGTGRGRRHRTRDLFGFIDVLVLEKGRGLLAIQVTDWTNVAKRITKAQENPVLSRLLSCGRAEVWAWKEREEIEKPRLEDSSSTRDGGIVRMFTEGKKRWLLKIRSIEAI